MTHNSRSARPLSDPNGHLRSSCPWAAITGASSGIGRAIAFELARRGYGTLLIARREPLLQSLADELRAFAPCRVLGADLADVADVARVADELASHKPALRVLVNNAGIGVYGEFAEQQRHFERLLQVNVLAPHRLISAALPAMMEADEGRIVNICSMSAFMGPWGHTGYAATKAALRSLTECLEAELRGSGVRAIGVYPGIVDTAWFKQPTMPRLWERVRHRAISPERVARAVARAIDRPRIAVVVPWHYRLLPLIAGVSPSVAMRLVRAGSVPPTPDLEVAPIYDAHRAAHELTVHDAPAAPTRGRDVGPLQPVAGSDSHAAPACS